MRFMVMIKANRDTEAGVMPSEDVLAAMGQYNEELVNAGVMLGGEGLHPSIHGARVHFSEGRTSVVDGPFVETRELIAGYWILQTGSLQETIDWVKHCPASAIGNSEIEIRQIFEPDDFGAEFTPELREQEDRLRAQITQ
ncbi:YciI family protein [Stutzerimonas xanthomarina]|uniref:YciI family protein n=1 Tax=Stutzerimonas xanthomarina TaxID=271420 RepID=UPI003AA9A7AA